MAQTKKDVKVAGYHRPSLSKFFSKIYDIIVFCTTVISRLSTSYYHRYDALRFGWHSLLFHARALPGHSTQSEITGPKDKYCSLLHQLPKVVSIQFSFCNVWDDILGSPLSSVLPNMWYFWESEAKRSSEGGCCNTFLVRMLPRWPYFRTRRVNQFFVSIEDNCVESVRYTAVRRLDWGRFSFLRP